VLGDVTFQTKTFDPRAVSAGAELSGSSSVRPSGRSREDVGAWFLLRPVFGRYIYDEAAVPSP